MPKRILGGGGEEETGIAQATGRHATEGPSEQNACLHSTAESTKNFLQADCRKSIGIVQSELEAGHQKDPVVKEGHFSCTQRKSNRKVGMHNLARRLGCLCPGIVLPV